jgi:hypothetical protein
LLAAFLKLRWHSSHQARPGDFRVPFGWAGAAVCTLPILLVIAFIFSVSSTVTWAIAIAINVCGVLIYAARAALEALFARYSTPVSSPVVPSSGFDSPLRVSSESSERERLLQLQASTVSPSGPRSQRSLLASIGHVPVLTPVFEFAISDGHQQQALQADALSLAGPHHNTGLEDSEREADPSEQTAALGNRQTHRRVSPSVTAARAIN